MPLTDVHTAVQPIFVPAAGRFAVIVVLYVAAVFSFVTVYVTPDDVVSILNVYVVSFDHAIPVSVVVYAEAVPVPLTICQFVSDVAVEARKSR